MPHFLSSSFPWDSPKIAGYVGQCPAERGVVRLPTLTSKIAPGRHASLKQTKTLESYVKLALFQIIILTTENLSMRSNF